MPVSKKRVINPAPGETFYYIQIEYGGLMEIRDSICDWNGDFTMAKKGNYFKTRREAENKLSQIKKLLKSE